MAAAELGTNDGSLMKRRGSNEFMRPAMSEQNNGDEDGGRTMTGKAKPPLNLLLLGRKGAGKTSAAKAILGQTELDSASKISESVKNQGEVSRRWVSVVELPALYGRSEQEVMEESFRCISLCDPEGVHAFILVLPVGPLTDEDKGELQTIQDTFRSVVKDFIMILFTVESDPDVVKIVEKDRDIQELIHSCGRRYVVVNIKDQQQVPELLEMVETISRQGSRFFSKDMFIRDLIGRSLKPKTELQDVKQKIEDRQSKEQLRKKIEEVKNKKEQQQKKQREEIKALQAQLEQEKKQKVQMLKEKDDYLEKREKEHEEDKRKWKKQNESQWKQKLDASEKRANFERQQRKVAEKKLNQCTRGRIRERDAWDKEKDKFWKETHQELKQKLQDMKKELEDEKTGHRKLQEEFYRKRRKWTYVFVTFLFSVFLLWYIYQSH